MSNVVSLFAKKVETEEPKEGTEAVETEFDFNSSVDRNKKNKERVERERLSANKGVLRSYRIKH